MRTLSVANARTVCADWTSMSSIFIKSIGRQKSSKEAGAPITSLQPPYSLVRREVEQEVLPYCRSNGMGVIVYSPMASGLLTGAMTRAGVASLPASEWGRRELEFKETKRSKTYALLERLRP